MHFNTCIIILIQLFSIVMQDIYHWILWNLLYDEILTVRDADLHFEFEVTRNGLDLKLSDYNEEHRVNI